MRAAVMLPSLLAAVSAAPALALQFEPRAGLQALATSATGVFEIGAVDLGPVETVLRALVHNGQILQVHSRQGGEWLAKRSGSVGGKPIAPTGLDVLAQIAGGLDTDVRCAPPDVRAAFARAAGVMMLASPVHCGPRADRSSADRQLPSSTAADTPRIDCSANRCRVIHDNGTLVSGFQIKIEPAPATWGFEGYGIVAIWTIPDD